MMSGENNSTAVQPISISPSQAWDGNDGPWSSFFLGIGTPLQYFRVLISTTCPQPWVIDPQGCTPQDPPDCAKTRGEVFYANTSSTWEGAGLYELDLEQNLGYTGNGDFGFDTIALGVPGSTSGAYILQRQILASIATKEFYIATWGIAPRPTNLTTLDNSHPSLLSTLKEQNRIPSLSYAYTAGAPYRLTKVLGSLTLGGYDASRFTPSNVSFRFASDSSRDLVVGIQSIIVSNASQENSHTNLLPTPILSFIDSTIPHTWLPLDACQAFEAAFGIEWDPFSELYLVNDTTHDSLLAQNASLTFGLSTDTTSATSLSIVLPYASFDLEVADTYPNVNSSTRYFPLKRAANESQYTLGRTFLQEAYLIMDYERSNFSVHQCAFSEDMEASIQPILSINVTNGTQPPAPPPEPLEAHAAPLRSKGALAGIIIAVIAGISVLLAAVWLLLRRRRRNKSLASQSPAQPPLDPSQCVQEFEVDGQSRLPELDSGAKVKKVDGGIIAAHEVMDKATAVHELP